MRARPLDDGDWKKKHQSKATPEQLELFEKNKHLHAKHDPIPATAAAASNPQGTPAPSSRPPSQAPPPGAGGLSDVCCTPADELCAPPTNHPSAAMASTRLAPAGPAGAVSIRLGVLTVSDRVMAGVYQDESGPEIRRTMTEYAESTGAFQVFSTLSYAVPDDATLISERICEMAASGCNLILTTVGRPTQKTEITNNPFKSSYPPSANRG